MPRSKNPSSQNVPVVVDSASASVVAGATQSAPTVRRSARLLASNATSDAKHDPEPITTKVNRCSSRRATAAATKMAAAAAFQQNNFRRSSRVRATQKTQESQSHDSLLDLAELTIPKVKLVRRQSTQTAGTSLTAPSTNPSSTNSLKRETPSASRSDEKSKRQKTKHSAQVDRFSLAYGEVGTTELHTEIAPCDQRNIGNVLEVPEYASEIYQHLYGIETRFTVPPYTSTHGFLYETDRKDIIDQILHAHFAWDCEEQVLFRAVQIIDRYSAKVQITSEEFPLVGCVALMIASKFDEVEALAVGNIHRYLNKYFDYHYFPSDIVETEILVLEELGYRIAGPTSWCFLQRFLTVTNPLETTKKLALYFLECTLYMENMLEYRPSAVAAAVVSLAIHNPWKHDESKSENDPISMQRELLTYTRIPFTLVTEIARSFEANIPIPSKLERTTTLQSLREKHRPGHGDNTNGYAAWLKYSRKEQRKVSTRCSPPRASHLLNDQSQLVDQTSS